ncbi:MAG: PKD domain-containing protein, partial [Thermoplasmata archaeon]
MKKIHYRIFVVAAVIVFLMIVANFSIPEKKIQNGSIIIYHLATAEEIEEWKKIVGVREEGRNYNIIIDGHGTGYAPPSQEEWNNMVGSLRIVDQIILRNGSLPSFVDHSNSTYFPKVGNQGQQGSCASWATAYYSNGYYQARDNNWTNASDGEEEQLMSPAWVYNKVNGGTDSGSGFYGNWQLIYSVGNAKEADMPYDDTDYISWGDEDAWRSAPQFRCGAIYSTSPDNITTIKSALASGYVVLMAIDAGQYDDGLGVGDDTITSDEYTPTTPNHANTIVGYDDNKTADNETGAFKIVNSWGENWGSEWNGYGYYWMTYDAFSELTTPVYWFDDIASYQPSLIGVWEFSSLPSRDADVALGIGSPDNPNETRRPIWDGGSHDFPDFMCLDITEFKEEWENTSTFFLQIGLGTNDGTISSFRVEYYRNGTIVRTSIASAPQDTPGNATTYFSKYAVHNVEQDTYHITIQEAIDNATNGDTIEVGNGTYFENVVIDKTVTLIGEDKETTKIDGRGAGDAIYVLANSVNISGFTIRNGGQEGVYVDGADNFSISNSIICNNGDVGILLNNSLNSSIINNIIFNNTYDGILLEHSDYNDLIGNVVYLNGIGNNGEGILLMHSNYCLILNNTAYENGEDGIILEPYSSYNNISHNVVYGNADCGILISTSSNMNTIYNNTVYNNTYDGILIEFSSGNNVMENVVHHNAQDGIYITSAGNATIFNCNIYSNNNCGLVIENASDSMIYSCIISNNSYGVYLNSSNNTIYHNNFIGNSQQAYDNGDNIWNDNYPSGGNYWDDYGGSDNNNDGIGDTPYNISGGNNRDEYPLMEPWGENTPIANFSYIINDRTVYFNASSSYDRDGSIVSYTWDFGDGTNGSGITVNHTYADYGIYNVTLTVTDDDGYEKNITKVISLITDALPPQITDFTPDIAYTGDSFTFNATVVDDTQV